MHCGIALHALTDGFSLENGHVSFFLIGLVQYLSANGGSSCLLYSSSCLSHQECEPLYCKVSVFCFAVTILDRLEFRNSVEPE